MPLPTSTKAELNRSKRLGGNNQNDADDVLFRELQNIGSQVKLWPSFSKMRGATSVPKKLYSQLGMYFGLSNHVPSDQVD